MAVFAIGLVLGGLLGWLFYQGSRRENARLDEEKQLLHQEKQIVLDFMHNMVEAIGEGVDRSVLFQRVVHASILSTGALSAAVFEKQEGDLLRGVAVEGLFPPQKPLPNVFTGKASTRSKFIEQVLRSETFRVGEGLIGMVARTGRAVLIPDAREDQRVVQHDDDALKVRSVIVAPIRFRDTSIGVLAVVNPADGLSFNETDYSLVESLAEQAGLAIHNADVMNLRIEKTALETDVEFAAVIQGLLLPKEFPPNEKLQIDAVYLPAKRVGGDLYDVVQLDEHRVGVAIADVSGKGTPAGIVMAICQTNLRHFARTGLSPGEVLKSINRTMLGDMREGMFITMVYAVIDAQEQTITVARAGHELPLLFHREGDDGIAHANAVKSEGMALGLVPEMLFDRVIEEHTRSFVPGDIFLLYTDGVTEAANPDGVEFSSGRLADLVSQMRGRSAGELNAGVLEAVNRFAGDSGQTDDITLLTVKFRR